MADALHLLSFADYIHELEGMNNVRINSYFVSSNSGDFSSKTNKEELHPDLVPIFEKSGIKYSHVFHKLINEVERTLLSNEEREYIDNAEEWLYCFDCDFEMSIDDFSTPIEIFDPNKYKGGSMDGNQIDLFNNTMIKPEHPYSKIREGACSNCGTSYVICPGCNEFIVMGDSNSAFSCDFCSYKMILHSQRDRKGYEYLREFEIILDEVCIQCGNIFDPITNERICEVCLAYEKLAINN
jgi:predicted RNA-binding Zn-ribbon protein involved in translation (DUF1610 family)